MRRQAVSCIASLLVATAAITSGNVLRAQAFPPTPRSEIPADISLISRVADTGIDIVRMPPGPPPSRDQPPTIIPASPQAPLPVPPTPPAAPRPAAIQPAHPAGRTLSMPVRIGSLSSDAQKGWLGVRMETVELPLALSLGRVNTNGALIVETTPGGPAHLAGLRFGDIVLGYNGKTVEAMNSLRDHVSATAPGNQVVLEVWRVGVAEGDFLQVLRRLGDGGNAYIMYRLGRMYGGGIGVPHDDTEAVRWFRKSSDVGNLHAMTALALAHLEGRGADKNTQEAVRLLKVAAGKEHPDAMHRMGLLMIQGNLVEKDTLEAVRLFTKSAEAGHVPAMVDLGLVYVKGEGVQADPFKAAMWYKRAADQGNSSGMVNLGFMYQQGKGVEQNDVAAVNLYRKAAADGNAAGIHNLAAMYDSGKGVERKDPEQAADLILRALEMRNQFSYLQMTQHSNGWTREFRRALQRKLKEAGVYGGRIDGTISASTISAINAYINRNR